MCAKQRIQLSLLHRLSNMRSSSSSNMSLYKVLLHVAPSTYDHRYINYVSTSLRHRAYLVLNHIFLETLHKAVCKIFAGMRFGDPVVHAPRLVRFIMMDLDDWDSRSNLLDKIKNESLEFSLDNCLNSNTKEWIHIGRRPPIDAYVESSSGLLVDTRWARLVRCKIEIERASHILGGKRLCRSEHAHEMDILWDCCRVWYLDLHKEHLEKSK